MVQLLSFYRGKTLESLLSRFPVKEFEDDSEYYWEVIGSARRNIPLIEARETPTGDAIKGTTMVGQNTAPFYLVFGENWFADGETIVGELNEVYQFIILEEPRNEGSNWVYKVELGGGNTEGVPADRLQAGEKFSIEAAFVERELSRGVGDRLTYVTLQLIAA